MEFSLRAKWRSLAYPLTSWSTAALVLSHWAVGSAPATGKELRVHLLLRMANAAEGNTVGQQRPWCCLSAMPLLAVSSRSAAEALSRTYRGVMRQRLLAAGVVHAAGMPRNRIGGKTTYKIT